MDSKQFTKLFKAKLSDKLIKYFGDKMDTSHAPLIRTSHAYTFYIKVLNSIGEVLTDYDIAGYKIDDFHDTLVKKGIVEAEQKRLMDDIDNCENIVLFIVDKIYLK